MLTSDPALREAQSLPRGPGRQPPQQHLSRRFDIQRLFVCWRDRYSAGNCGYPRKLLPIDFHGLGVVLVPTKIEGSPLRGALPPEFKNGRVIEPVTVRAGSRFAAQGMREKYAPNMASVVLVPDWDFSCDETLVIRFRYLMVEPALRIRLQIYNHDQRQNYQLDLTEVYHGQWTDAELSLADMKPVRDTVRHMVAGDRLTIVYVMGGAPDGNAILVDDLTVLRRGR